MIHDAIVVGAGLSGLVAARRLADAGRDVVVLEARDRVGGRTLTARLAGAEVDVGGQWLSVGQLRLAALADELGVASYAQFRDGEPTVALPAASGGVTRLLRAFGARRWMRRFERMIAAALDDPPQRAAWDATTLAAWLERTLRDADLRTRIALHAELTFAASPADLSLCFYLETVARTGGLGGPDEHVTGGRERRFVGGAQQLSLRLAAGLDVRLGAPVTAITDDGVVVRARGDAGEVVARRLILAVPPHLARRIAVELPAGARRFADATAAGGVVKVIAAYDTAFWRDDGRSGEAYAAGLIRATVDLSQPDGPPALLAFVVGDAAAGWARDPDGHRAAAIAELAALFGDPAAAPIDVIVHDWVADRWSAGCVAGLPPGALTAGAAWRGPTGRIHLAGTEAAQVWPGYLEGAIDAGERAAAEVLSAP